MKLLSLLYIWELFAVYKLFVNVTCTLAILLSDKKEVQMLASQF